MYLQNLWISLVLWINLLSPISTHICVMNSMINISRNIDVMKQLQHSKTSELDKDSGKPSLRSERLLVWNTQVQKAQLNPWRFAVHIVFLCNLPKAPLHCLLKSTWPHWMTSHKWNHHFVDQNFVRKPLQGEFLCYHQQNSSYYLCDYLRTRPTRTPWGLKRLRVELSIHSFWIGNYSAFIKVGNNGLCNLCFSLLCKIGKYSY